MAALEDKMQEEWLNAKCTVCGKQFHLKPYQLKRTKTHYCSHDCQNIARKQYMKGAGNHQYGLKGELNASWRGGKYTTYYGYIAVKVQGHPFAHSDGVIFEHRLVAEKYLLTEENSVLINGKRYLKPDYVVHHKNHIRNDNRPENLEVMPKGKHSSMHCKEHPAKTDPVTHRFVSWRYEK